MSMCHVTYNMLSCRIQETQRGLPLSTYAPRGRGGGSTLLYISIAYNMQKGGEGVQIACKVAYVLNGRPLTGFQKQLTIMILNYCNNFGFRDINNYSFFMIATAPKAKIHVSFK